MHVQKRARLDRRRTLATRLRHIGLIAVFLATPVWAQQLYSIERDAAALVEIDPADATSIDSVAITLAGETVDGGNGLAAHPATLALYGLLRIDGQSGRELVTIDPNTGVATSIGNTGLELEGLAFDSTGALFGVTDRAAPLTERIFTINITDGSTAELTTMDQEDIGEAIAFHDDDETLFRLTETGKVSPPLFQSIELSSPFNDTNHTLTGDEFGVATAMTYIGPGSGEFYMTDELGGFFTITDTGDVSFIGTLEPLRGEGPPEEGGLSKGLAIIPEPAGLVLLGLGAMCVATRRRIRSR